MQIKAILDASMQERKTFEGCIQHVLDEKKFKKAANKLYKLLQEMWEKKRTSTDEVDVESTFKNIPQQFHEELSGVLGPAMLEREEGVKLIDMESAMDILDSVFKLAARKIEESKSLPKQETSAAQAEAPPSGNNGSACDAGPDASGDGGVQPHLQEDATVITFALRRLSTGCAVDMVIDQLGKDQKKAEQLAQEFNKHPLKEDFESDPDLRSNGSEGAFGPMDFLRWLLQSESEPAWHFRTETIAMLDLPSWTDGLNDQPDQHAKVDKPLSPDSLESYLDQMMVEYDEDAAPEVNVNEHHHTDAGPAPTAAEEEPSHRADAVPEAVPDANPQNQQHDKDKVQEPNPTAAAAAATMATDAPAPASEIPQQQQQQHEQDPEQTKHDKDQDKDKQAFAATMAPVSVAAETETKDQPNDQKGTGSEIHSPEPPTLPAAAAAAAATFEVATQATATTLSATQAEAMAANESALAKAVEVKQEPHQHHQQHQDAADADVVIKPEKLSPELRPKMPMTGSTAPATADLDTESWLIYLFKLVSGFRSGSVVV